jgi:ABC-type branched-subunit amino acid transport system substrate-binding protein
MQTPILNTARLIALTATVLTLYACAPVPPTPVLVAPDGSLVEAPPAPSEQEETDADKLLAQSRTQRAQGQTAQASQTQNQLIKKWPGTTAAAHALFEQAKQAHDNNQSSIVIEKLEKLLFYRPDFPNIDSARELYARVLVAVRRYEDAAGMLGALYASATDNNKLVQLGKLYIRSLREIARPAEALRVCVDLRAIPSLTNADKEAVETLARTVVSSRLSFNEIESMWTTYGANNRWAFIHPMLGFKLAKVFYHTRDYQRSETMLKELIARYPQTLYGKEASSFYERLKNRFIVQASKIGILLPLSGRFGQYGKQALESIKLAFQDSAIELIVKDSRGDPTVAASAVEDLVLQDHVIGIIGPIVTKPSLAAAQKAEEFSIPIISLSYKVGGDMGTYVFRAALTIETQARSLAKFAFEEMGMTRFALLHPRTPYGAAFVKAFWTEVDERQGEIRGVESYDHDQTTFTEPVRKLVGRWYRTSRQDYRDKLQEIRAKKLPSHREAAAIEKMQKNLPPITDFDAIVIPDSAKRLGLIAPALAFEDIVVTRNDRELKRIKRATGYKDIKPITLLGASTWNHPYLSQKCQRYCENAIFVDGYYRDHPAPLVRDFDSAFREVFGKSPQLSDAQAFDTAGIVRAILEMPQAPLKGRDDLRKALLGHTGFKGVMGNLEFDDKGEAVKDLFVLTLKNNTIQLFEKPEPKPEN